MQWRDKEQVQRSTLPSQHLLAPCRLLHLCHVCAATMQVMRDCSLDDGDVARLLTRTVDLLRQVGSLCVLRVLCMGRAGFMQSRCGRHTSRTSPLPCLPAPVPVPPGRLLRHAAAAPAARRTPGGCCDGPQTHLGPGGVTAEGQAASAGPSLDASAIA